MLSTRQSPSGLDSGEPFSNRRLPERICPDMSEKGRNSQLKFLHLERGILFHGHEPLDTDTTSTLEGEYWLLHNNYCQAEGVRNLDKVPESGALIVIGFARPEGGSGGFARYIAICPPEWRYGKSVLEDPGAPLPENPHPLHRDENGVLKPAQK